MKCGTNDGIPSGCEFECVQQVERIEPLGLDVAPSAMQTNHLHDPGFMSQRVRWRVVAGNRTERIRLKENWQE